MKKTISFTTLISILLVLSIAVFSSAADSGGVSVDSTPPQINVVSPNNNILVGQSIKDYFLLSYSEYNNELEIGESRPIFVIVQLFSYLNLDITII